MSGSGVHPGSVRAACPAVDFKRHRGFDLVRFAALGMVVCQHLETLHGINSKFLLPGIDIGQLGVVIFCALSGFFCFAGSTAATGPWLLRRLGRIYIPLWLTLIPLFAANALANYKPTTGWLIASEFAGTGYFTHPDELVGVHLWFISLIVPCYVLAATARAFRWALWPLTACAAVAAQAHVGLANYVVAFLLAGIVGASSRPFTWAAALGLAASAAMLMAKTTALPAVAWSPAAAGLCAVALAQGLSSQFSAIRWTLPPGVCEASYHFYLVHGPAYLLAAKLAPANLLADLTFGTLLALGSAAVLYRLDLAFRRQLRQAALLRRPITA